jgi:hypothetical protein
MPTEPVPMTEESAAISAVRNYLDSFNKGDAIAMDALCTVPMSILDGLPPHAWNGPTASGDWYKDGMVAGEQKGATDYLVELGEPSHLNVTADSAYAVVPTALSFKVHGKPITQSGATFTVALRKLNDGWRLAAWAWTKGSVQPSA